MSGKPNLKLTYFSSFFHVRIQCYSIVVILIIFVIILHLIHPQIYNLRPDTPYVFMIRSENAYGVSVPGEMSEIIHTLGEKSIIPEQTLTEARSKLSGKVIVLKELFAETSTTIRVAWEVRLNKTNL